MSDDKIPPTIGDLERKLEKLTEELREARAGGASREEVQALLKKITALEEKMEERKDEDPAPEAEEPDPEDVREDENDDWLGW